MSSPVQTYYAHGKLLLTGEYFVLDGARALAVPTRWGQRLTWSGLPYNEETPFKWVAYDRQGEVWFASRFHGGPDWAHTTTTADTPEGRIVQIMRAAEELRPGCTRRATHYTQVSTHLEFDRHWGLGSSSTLIHCVAEWLGVNPYALLERTFGGSGYDLACAGAEGPLVYVRNGTAPRVTPTDWRPAWTERTVFVYRNQKQNSRAGIRAYRGTDVAAGRIDEVSDLTDALLQARHLRAAAHVLREHERLVADTLGLPPVGEELFADFPGTVKSLGAWGGDFVWALSERPVAETTAYFNARGFAVVIPYNDMVLPPA